MKILVSNTHSVGVFGGPHAHPPWPIACTIVVLDEGWEEHLPGVLACMEKLFAIKGMTPIPMFVAVMGEFTCRKIWSVRFPNWLTHQFGKVFWRKSTLAMLGPDLLRLLYLDWISHPTQATETSLKLAKRLKRWWPECIT